MCRWLAYSGPSLALEDLLFKPENSLIRQSLIATQSIVPTNGDGFGLGWYGGRTYPGIYRDTLPAWNDTNLRSLSEQISAGLFFAHVRASTGTSTSRANCHPFHRDRLMFMHNGRIGGFAEIRRDIESLIPDAFYRDRLGTTDSEAFFLLACGNGLAEDPAGALRRTIAQVLEVKDAAGTDQPFRMTAAVSDGRRMHALRFSSDNRSPTLYYARGGTVEVRDRQVCFTSGDAALLVLSEPLDDMADNWTAIPDAHLLEATDGRLEVQPFAI